MQLYTGDSTLLAPGLRITAPNGRAGTVTAVAETTFAVHWDGNRGPLTHPGRYAGTTRREFEETAAEDLPGRVQTARAALRELHNELQGASGEALDRPRAARGADRATQHAAALAAMARFEELMELQRRAGELLPRIETAFRQIGPPESYRGKYIAPAPGLLTQASAAGAAADTERLLLDARPVLDA